MQFLKDIRGYIMIALVFIVLLSVVLCAVKIGSGNFERIKANCEAAGGEIVISTIGSSICISKDAVLKVTK